MAGMGSSVGDIFATLKLNSKQFERATDRATSGFTNKVGKMMKTTARMMWRGTLALSAYGTASAKAFATFEDAIVRSAAVTTGAVGEMREAMEQAALSMSKESILTSKDLAEGYFALGQAGFNAAQSLKALPVVVDFAVASQLKLDTATRFLVRTLEGLGMASADPIRNMQQMERVSNVFTFAAIKTTAEIRDFAVAMTHAAAPALRLVNKSMEEGTSVLMAFARAGIVGEEAGTLLWTTVRDLQRAAIKARGEWRELGLEIFDAGGKMRNLADIFGDLEGKFSNMSDEEKKVRLMLLGFQDRSLRGIQALMGFSDQMKEFEKEMGNISDLTEDLADNYLESFLSQMKMAWHHVKEISILFGKELAPSILSVTDFLKANQEVVKKWALSIAGKIADAILEVKNFVAYLMSDWRGGLELALEASLELFSIFATASMSILRTTFVHIGQNVFAWIKEGMASKTALMDAVNIRFLEEFPIGQFFGRLTPSKIREEKERIKKEFLALGPDYFRDVVPETEVIPFKITAKSIKADVNKAIKELGKLGEIFNNTDYAKQKMYTENMDKLRGALFKVGVVAKTAWGRSGTLFQAMFGEHPEAEVKNVADAIISNASRVKLSIEGVLREPLREMNLQLNSQYESLGKTNDELAIYNTKLAIASLLEQEFAKREVWDRDEIIAFNAELDKQVKILNDIAERGKKIASVWDASRQWGEDALKVWQNLGEGLARGLDSFADTLTQQLAKGKADWKAFMASILTDWLNTLIKMQMAEMWLDILQPSLGGLFGPTDELSALTTAAGPTGMAFAKGGIFSSGRIVPMADGGLVNTATLVPMANGSTAMMGEDGTEAVMPLKRNSQGKLGVLAENPPVVVRPKYKFVTLFSEVDLADAMKTDAGEEAILNVVKRNGLG